jgi:hypothetical protein
MQCKLGSRKQPKLLDVCTLFARRTRLYKQGAHSKTPHTNRGDKNTTQRAGGWAANTTGQRDMPLDQTSCCAYPDCTLMSTDTLKHQKTPNPSYINIDLSLACLHHHKLPLRSYCSQRAP